MTLKHGNHGHVILRKNVIHIFNILGGFGHECAFFFRLIQFLVQTFIFFQQTMDIPHLDITKFPSHYQQFLLLVERQRLHWRFGFLVNDTLCFISDL